MEKSVRYGLIYFLIVLLLVCAGCGTPKSFEERIAINISNSPYMSESNPSISADGKKLVFDAYTSGNREIFFRNLETGNLLNVSNSPANDYQPSISLDGKKVVFISDRDGNSEIYTVNLADIFYVTGLQLKQHGNIEAAISNFKQAINTDSSHTPSHHQLGSIYDERKDYDKAIEEFSIVASIYTKELLESLADEIKEQ